MSTVDASAVSKTRRRPGARAVSIVSLVAVAAVLLGHRDAGVTFDEGAQARYGDLALRYYATSGADDRVHSFYNLRYYGPGVEMLAQSLSRPGDPAATSFERRHLVLGLLAVLVLPALAGFVGIAGSGRLVLFAVLILATLPRFAGHALNNSKDVPFALAIVLFVAAVTRMFARGEYGWRSVLAAGGAMGLVIAIRPGGLSLLAVFFLAISILVRRIQGDGRPTPTAAGVPLTERAVSLRKLAVLAVAWMVLFVFWPWAHAHPLVSLPQAAAHSLSFPRPIPVLFHGSYVDSGSLPRTYLVQMLAFTTPPTVLALVAIGLAGAVADVLRRGEDRGRAVVGAVAILWVLAPLILFMVRRPAAYDGIRHFLFVLPGLAVVGAFGAERLVEAARSRIGVRLAMALGVAVALLPLWSVGRLHPYASSYYNVLVGGVAGAQGQFDTDYWMSAYREAIRWVDPMGADGTDVLMAGLPIPGPEDLASGPACWTDRRPPAPQIVSADFLAAPARHAAARGVRVWTLPEVWEAGLPAGEMEYYLATTRWGYDRCFPGAEIVYRVQREGATFAVVKRLTGAGAAELAAPRGAAEVPSSPTEPR